MISERRSWISPTRRCHTFWRRNKEKKGGREGRKRENRVIVSERVRGSGEVRQSVRCGLLQEMMRGQLGSFKHLCQAKRLTFKQLHQSQPAASSKLQPLAASAPDLFGEDTTWPRAALACALCL